MFDMKKTALAALALTSQLATAGTMGKICNPIVSTVPCETQAWDAGISGLYLNTTYNNDFVFNESTNIGNDLRYRQHENKWDWGFKLQGSYHYGTGSDININWYHFKKSTNYYGNYLILVNDPSQLFNVGFTPRWNAINLEFGQLANFSTLENIRFHGGIQFSRFTHEIQLAQLDNSIFSSAITRFTGMGPRLGADMAYALGHGVSIYANGATSLLVGTSGFDQFLATNNPLTAIHNSGSRRTLTPELEAKLGAAYNYMIAQGVFGLDVGYMWVNYFHPHQILPTQESDFALHGAYFGLTYTGNV